MTPHVSILVVFKLGAVALSSVEFIAREYNTSGNPNTENGPYKGSDSPLNDSDPTPPLIVIFP